MRGDDRPSRYPPRGVWFGLVLAAWTLCAPALAQAAQDAAARGPAEPLVLSAERVSVWGDADERYLSLSGMASALQGTEGLRSARAVCRIVNLSKGGDPLYEVEIYAEGNVHDTSRKEGALESHRAMFRASEVQIQAYGRGGVNALRSPPRSLDILRRSGFLTPTQPPTSAGTPKSAEAAPLAAVQKAPARSPTEQKLPTFEPVADHSGDGSLAAAGQEVSSPPPLEAVGQGDPPPRRSRPKVDQMVVSAQMTGDKPPGPDDEPDGGPLTQEGGAQPPSGGTPRQPIVDLPPIEGEGPPGIDVPALPQAPQGQPPSVEALPRTEPETSEPQPVPEGPARRPAGPIAPILPGTRRVTSITPRSGREVDLSLVATTPEGVEIYVVRGGVNIVVNAPEKFGIIDIEADQAVIWRGPQPKEGESQRGPNGEYIDDANRHPMEVYLEGNVIVRQDQRKWAGRGDQRTLRAPQVYYNLLTDRFIANKAEIDVFAPGLLAPLRIKSPRIEQYHELVKQPDGTLKPSEHPKIRADKAVTTGSRFPNPGYSIYQKSLDLTRYANPATDPISGQHLANPGDPNPPQDLIWKIDARQNFYYMGPFPAFYWPRVVADVDDQQPALRQFFFRTNNYFGQQLLTDWNGFRFINVKKPDWIDLWNVDFDYLSRRTTRFPALGSEIGWFGRDLIKDLRDPYHRNPAAASGITEDYYGYFTIWGLQDAAPDNLGQGPAIVTNGPPGAGKRGYQMSSTPAFQQDRLRLDFRHMQSFLPNDEEHEFEDLRVQAEIAYYTDRYFLFEYFQRLWDVGMDQETLAYGYYQKDNQFMNLWVEGNPMNWRTETEWLPRFDYYRIGDSFFNNLFTYYQHSGLDYATITTDIMVNNPNLFAYMPFDPISNTTGIFSSGRFYTSHELDMPLNFFNAVRVVPYVQGQLVGWTDQIGKGPLGFQPAGALGRAWGAVGVRPEMTFWKKYPTVESEILNVHGLNNKISLFADARAAWSNQRLNHIAVQDDLDDNTYEFVRRYLAITSFKGGILPFPYDPRHYILRNMVSPITGTTDIQSSLYTVSLGLHQRLQTKRGPIGKRRIVDFMTLDATTTYFPDAARDNFGANWGLTQYNYQWYLGDRTSIISQGWFEFWKLVGSQPLSNNMVNGYNPNGLNVITSGINLSRPPRSNIFLGYTIIDTGPIRTSALNTSISYWLSPKWYGTFSNSYDFGNGVNLYTGFTFTRIGADYLTTLGLSVDPQRGSYQAAVQITPRMSPAFRLGSNSAMQSFDTRFAPSQ